MADTSVINLVKRLAVQISAEVLRTAVPRFVGEEGPVVQVSYATINLAERAVLDWIDESGNNHPSDNEIRSQLRRNMGVVYLVQGKDQGRLAWHYVLIDPDMFQAFQSQLSTRNVDVSRYGRILESGWGQNPPSSITRAIEQQYS
jgi:hypothetical protein